MALTRDHENGVSQQSLTRFECADSPFGLMPYGIANANLRILPSGCCATPTRNAPSGYTKSHESFAWYLYNLCRAMGLWSKHTKLHESFAGDSSYSLPISVFVAESGMGRKRASTFSCLFVWRDDALSCLTMRRNPKGCFGETAWAESKTQGPLASS